MKTIYIFVLTPSPNSTDAADISQIYSLDVLISFQTILISNLLDKLMAFKLKKPNVAWIIGVPYLIFSKWLFLINWMIIWLLTICPIQRGQVDLLFCRNTQCIEICTWPNFASKYIFAFLNLFTFSLRITLDSVFQCNWANLKSKCVMFIALLMHISHMCTATLLFMA